MDASNENEERPVDVASFSDIPSVHRILAHDASSDLAREFGKTAFRDQLNRHLDRLRGILESGNVLLKRQVAPAEILVAVERNLQAGRTRLLRVINATGVVLHTNLGRAPIPRRALARLSDIASGYCNLEYDLEDGRRGTRGAQIERQLCSMFGAERALVVNNNAAAVFLCLDAIAKGKRVLIARSQMVEIGGGFRIPEILRKSGCELVEVGCTNKVHLHDYRTELEATDVGLVLVVHRSNFEIGGFVSEPPLQRLVDTSHRHDVPILFDMGSGLVRRPDTGWLDDSESSIAEALSSGADLVTFSGDKLLGGPQAGVILSAEKTSELMTRIRRNPLHRAMRADKTTLVLLGEVLRSHSENITGFDSQLPVIRMLSQSAETVEGVAREFISSLSRELVERLGLSLTATTAATGGGAYPSAEIPSWGIEIDTESPEQIAMELRCRKTPIIGRIREGSVLLDFRTILPDELEEIEHALLELSGLD